MDTLIDQDDSANADIQFIAIFYLQWLDYLIYYAISSLQNIAITELLIIACYRDIASRRGTRYHKCKSNNMHVMFQGFFFLGRAISAGSSDMIKKGKQYDLERKRIR